MPPLHFGPIATAHMARYGTTTLDFAHLAVTERSHAVLNQKAMMRKPITIDDHQSSRWIIYPVFRLLDCCQESDGGVALVITSAERARDLKQAPVYIMSGMGGQGQTAELWETNGVNSAPLLYEGAGITPRDVSIAEIYDPFTFMCMTHIEDFGLVKKGEIGGWVTAGHNRLDGDFAGEHPRRPACPKRTFTGSITSSRRSSNCGPKALSTICARALTPMTVPPAARCETPRSRWCAANVARAPCC